MQVRRPVSAASPVTSWLYNTQQLHQAALAGHTLVASPGTGMRDGGYITIGMSQKKMKRMNTLTTFISILVQQVHRRS